MYLCMNVCVYREREIEGEDEEDERGMKNKNCHTMLIPLPELPFIFFSFGMFHRFYFLELF